MESERERAETCAVAAAAGGEGKLFTQKISFFLVSGGKTICPHDIGIH
jgi:hypothetical protein